MNEEQNVRRIHDAIANDRSPKEDIEHSSELDT